MCSICRAPEQERNGIVQLIDLGKSDRDIERLTRFARMTAWRFRQHLRAERDALYQRARELRLRKLGKDARVVVEMNGEFLLDGRPFDLREFTEDDWLVTVTFDPLPDVFPNPPHTAVPSVPAETETAENAESMT